MKKSVIIKCFEKNNKKIKKTSHRLPDVKATPSFAYHWGWLRKMKAKEKASVPTTLI